MNRVEREKFLERIIHDAGEFGEENVDEIDKEWAEFESFMRLVGVLGSVFSGCYDK